MKIGFKFPSGKFNWNALVSPKSPAEPLEAPFPELQTEGLVFLDVFKPNLNGTKCSGSRSQ